jgi:hypothetical protein
LPYLAAAPLIVICLVAISRLASFSPLFQRWRPQWTKPFIEEEFIREDEGNLKGGKSVLFWSILTLLATVALVLQIAKLVILPDLRVSAILLLVSWTLNVAVIAISRPKRCPTSLLLFYVTAFTAESAGLRSGTIARSLEDVLHTIGGLIPLVSVITLLLMPLKTMSPLSGSISTVGSQPTNTERTPEDGLRLWQFLTVSWVQPLLSIGNQRQLEKEDVWALGFEFQTARLAQGFRELRGSVLWRLLKANGIDCCILVLISFISLFCGTHTHSYCVGQRLTLHSRLCKPFSTPETAADYGEACLKPSPSRCHGLCTSSVASPGLFRANLGFGIVVRSTMLRTQQRRAHDDDLREGYFKKGHR